MKAGAKTISSASSAPAWSLARGAEYLELTKPRITGLVLVTTFVGFYLGSRGSVAWPGVANTLIGTALVAGGASALNMWAERRADSMMLRTSSRPLPAGKMQPREALLFALAIAVAGLVYLAVSVGPLPALLALITVFGYLMLYTPLKTRTWLCTVVGAAPGAVPPMIGWAAAVGGLGLGAWLLFAILFLWQLPHFYAIGWMYRDDYARAGFPMLPVIDSSGGRTSFQVNGTIAALVLVSIAPFARGLAGGVYLAGSIVLGAAFLAFGIIFARGRDRRSARNLFVFSVCYLPALLALLVFDRV